MTASASAEPLVGRGRRYEIVGKLRTVWRGLPWEPTLVNIVAIAVGIYAGVATGLLGGFISVFQMLFFRPSELFNALTGRDPTWFPVFRHQLAIAPWHFELLAFGVIALVAGEILSPVAEWEFLRRMPIVEKRQLRLLARILGFGLVLYYPLLVLASFTSSFGAAEGGLLSIVLGAPRWLWVFVPVLGGLIVGPLIRFVAPESGGHGVAEVVEAVATGKAEIPGKVALWKSMLAGLTIGTGGSCGREGPVVHMGAAVGNELSRRLGLSRESTSLLLAAGGAAGIAASFNAPIAGALFGLEIILGDFAVASVSPVVLASVTATVTARALAGAAGEVVHIHYSLKTPGEIAAYVVLGLLCGAGAVGYAWTLHLSEKILGGEGDGVLAKRLHDAPVWLRPAVGGLGLGLVGLIAPRVLGNGYESMNAALLGELGLGSLVLVFLMKFLATGFTLGSGHPGGSFFPAVFLGAMLGGAFGSVLHLALPNLAATSGAYAAVGMGAFVAGATLAPLTGMLMIFELTGNYLAVPPLMVACGLSALVVHLVLGGSIYTTKLRARGIIRTAQWPSHLRHLTVGEAMARTPVTVPAGMSLAELRDRLAASMQVAFPVLDAAGRLAGMLDAARIREALYHSDGIDRLVVAAELCDRNPPTLREKDELPAAVEKIAQSRAPALPVVADDDPRRLVGLLGRREVIELLNAALSSGSAPAAPSPE